LKRLTDQEIVDFLHNEKHIEIARSTVTNTRNRLERQAAKWYLEIKQSASKYIAAYKERIDSLFSYQKTLHELILATKREDIKLRAISELHSIEMDVSNLWRQLPSLDIIADGQTIQIKEKQLRQGPVGQEEEGYESTQIPPVDDEDERKRFDKWNNEGKPMSDQYRARMQAQYGLTVEPWDQPSWIQCATCSRWFKNQWHWINHHCIEGFKKLKPGVAVG